MTMVITSYTPETGPVTGGTQVTVTGTGLSTCVAVLVGANEATIIGTPSATTVVFQTPPGAAAGTAKVALYDGTVVVEATDSFTYTAVSADEQLDSTLASKYRLDITADGGTTWTKVRGITTIKAGINYSSEDDSDIDSGVWTSTLNTGLGWQLTFTCKRGKGHTSGNYDPGQELVRAASDQLGTPSTVQIRWYDRTGGPEAYTGFANVQWAPQGGNKTGDKVDVTLNGQGARTVIDNPVIEDPSLAAGYSTTT